MARVLILGAVLCATLTAAEASNLDQRWTTTIRPLFDRYCMDCHDSDTSKGDVNLEIIRRPSDLAVAGGLAQHLSLVIEHEEMPTKRAKKQPTAAERAAMVQWIKDWQVDTARAHANDPGIVFMPRLTREEFAWVARDLTGVPTVAHEQIPGDGGAGEGFTNVGQAHTMTNDQVDAYLAAARGLLLQARIVPSEDIFWSPAPLREAATAADLRSQVVQQWGDWYRAQISLQTRREAAACKQAGYPSVIAAYLHAALLLRSGDDAPTVAAAMQPPLMPGVVARIAAWLGEDDGNPIRMQVRERVAAIPSGDTAATKAAAIDLGTWLADRVEDAAWSSQTSPLEVFANMPHKVVRQKIDDGVWHYQLDLTKAQGNRIYLAVSDCEDPAGDLLRWSAGKITVKGKTVPWQEVARLKTVAGATVAWGSTVYGATIDADAVVVQAPHVLVLEFPAGATALTMQATPDVKAGKDACMQTRVDISEPEAARWFLRRRLLGPKGSAGVKAAYAAMSAVRTDLFDPHRDFRWKDPYCLTDFAAACGFDLDWRAVGTAPDSKAKNASLWTPTPSEVRSQASDADRATLQAIGALLRGSLRDQATADLTASARHHIGAIAARCWRRAATSGEMDDLLGLYRDQRQQGAAYETAVKSALLGVLLSPHFLYRAQRAEAVATQALSDGELADRLSFALWGSLPDAELLELARAGRLQESAVLRQQVERMARDPRAVALAERFMGQWKGFAGFDQFSGPDQVRFKAFTPELRQAMYQECLQFSLHLFQADRPVIDTINARYSFLNEPLAKHYGIAGVSGSELRRVELPPDRVGMLTMGAFLTKTSTPLRTSPVLRGVWVYERLLGIELPPPPPVVPRLSDDERDDTGAPIRDQLARHRADAACATCHDKVDPLGIALEHFDPIGRRRTTDLAGDPIPAADRLPDGSVIDGIAGLAAWLDQQERHRSYSIAFTRKLLGYCLGRAVEVTDQPLIDELVANGGANGPTALTLLCGIIDSPQFRQRRNTPLYPQEQP